MTFEVWHDHFTLKVAYSLPEDHAKRGNRRYPVLCFLHGRGECERDSSTDTGKDIERAMAVHGPLAKGSSPHWTREFIVVCPQLKSPGGDVWKDHLSTVLRIVAEMNEKQGGDPSRTYLTGFSHGANGVLDIAASEEGIPWTALLVVDPTRAPTAKPQYPTWLSVGSSARKWVGNIPKEWKFQGKNEDVLSQFVVDDYGKGHAETSEAAYIDEAIYKWLTRVVDRQLHYSHAQ